MLSKTCEYALRAMIFIAQRSRDGSKVPVSEIARGIDSPEQFIAKILQDLSRRGVLQSTKGPNGGFFLEEKGMNIHESTVGETAAQDTRARASQMAENDPA